jgi:hypothetical protein
MLTQMTSSHYFETEWFKVVPVETFSIAMVAMVDHDYLEGLEANKTMVNRTIMYSNDTFGNISMTTTLKPPGDEMCPELAKKDRKVM